MSILTKGDFIITAFPRYRLLLMAFITEGGLLIFGLLLAWFFDIKLFCQTHHLFRDIFLGIFGTIFPFALFVFLLSEKAKKIPLIGALNNVIVNDIKTMFFNANLFDICLISFIAGFAEEILFRGVIQTKLGIVIASIIFGLLHFITYAYFIIATIMGFYLGFLFNYYDNLFIPIQIHFLYDFAALIYLRYYIKKPPYVLEHIKD